MKQLSNNNLNKNSKPMEENKQEFDPRDLNKDGKVSVKEQLLRPEAIWEEGLEQ